MEFDETKVFTALNAHKLKVGSKVILADTIKTLKEYVMDNRFIEELKEVLDESITCRFKGNNSYVLAYLVEEPEEREVRWTDFKIGDIIARHDTIALVNQIDKLGTYNSHIRAGESWLRDSELSEWKKLSSLAEGRSNNENN